jgi:C_GCAxxG_C_C family probable redox protein
MKNNKQNKSAPCLNRRDMLKLSVAAGITLASGAIPATASAASTGGSDINRPDYAKERFLKSMNCSQAILEAYAPSMGMPVKTARGVSAAFAGGMGMGSECGAVTGAFMVIGMKYGKTRDDDSRADNETFKRLAEFVKEFKKKHEYIGCSELLQTDMETPEGVKEAARKGLFTSRCPGYVKTAGEILEKLLV